MSPEPAGRFAPRLLSRLVRRLCVPILLAAALLPGRPAGGADDADRSVAAVRSGPVAVLHADGDAGYAREVAVLAAAAHAQIRADLGPGREIETAILLLSPNSPERTLDAWASRLPRWIAGIAIPAERFVVVRVPPGRTPRELEPVLVHELTHVIVRADFPLSDGWPLWFHEGLAMRETRAEGLRDQIALSAATLRDRLIPLERLAVRFPANEAEARLAYAESRSFLGFLEARFEPERFRAFLGQLRARPFDEAFRAAYGLGPGAAEGLWLRWAGRRYAWLPAITSGTTLWLLITLLFFVAAAARRRRSRLLRERWEAEERDEGIEP